MKPISEVLNPCPQRPEPGIYHLHLVSVLLVHLRQVKLSTDSGGFDPTGLDGVSGCVLSLHRSAGLFDDELSQWSQESLDDRLWFQDELHLLCSNHQPEFLCPPPLWTPRGRLQCLSAPRSFVQLHPLPALPPRYGPCWLRPVQRSSKGPWSQTPALPNSLSPPRTLQRLRVSIRAGLHPETE